MRRSTPDSHPCTSVHYVCTHAPRASHSARLLTSHATLLSCLLPRKRAERHGGSDCDCNWHWTPRAAIRVSAACGLFLLGSLHVGFWVGWWHWCVRWAAFSLLHVWVFELFCKDPASSRLWAAASSMRRSARAATTGWLAELCAHVLATVGGDRVRSRFFLANHPLA